AQGEVAELKDNINQMIANLRETTQRNAEQDWLKTNLASISGMLQGQRDLAAVTQLIMSEVTPTVNAQYGAFFVAEPGAEGGTELASVRPFSDVNRDFLDRIAETIGVVLSTIRANMRTEELLTQSQGLTQELQKQSEELRNTNDELEEKARLLSEQNRDIEVKNEEIELARRGLEDK